MSSLQFHLQRLQFVNSEDPADHAWRSVYTVLSDYVQPNSTLSLDEAIDRTAEFYEDCYYQSSPINHILIHLGDQIPYDNPAHTKLANYFLALGESQKWFAKSRHSSFKSAEMMYYQHMIEDISDELVDPAGRLKEGEDPMEYVNANAFAANFMSRDLMSKRRLLYVVSFLEEAMDYTFNRNHSEEPPQVHDAWVMGAAQWIIWRAEEAFSLVQKPGDPEIQKVRKKFYFWQSHKKTDAVEDIWPYSWNQWQAWKAGFRTVTGSEAYGLTCRNMAEKAADLMGLQEKSMTGRYPDSPLKDSRER